MRDLLMQRESWEALVNDPSLIPNAAEEMLRFAPSVFTWRRLATQTFEINGHTFNPGDRVLLSLGSANHDEHHFENPETLDITRKNAKDHLAFGHGIHYCLGAPLD